MQLNFPHKFSKFEAKQKVKQLLENARTQQEFKEKVKIEEERWENDTLHFAFTAEGQHISGKLEVKEREFDIYAKLPLMMRLFEGKIKRSIEEQTKQLLG